MCRVPLVCRDGLRARVSLPLRVPRPIRPCALLTICSLTNHVLLAVNSIFLGAPRVSFGPHEVPVIHWNTLVEKNIYVADSPTLEHFMIRIHVALRGDIATSTFRLYSLPHDFSDI